VKLRERERVDTSRCSGIEPLKEKDTKEMKQRAVNFGVVGVYSIMYVFIAFLVAFLGFLTPFGWVYSSVFTAVLGAFPYYKATSAFRSFGVSAIMMAFFALFLLVSDESDWERAVILVGSGVLSDLVRMLLGNTKAIGAVISYPIMAIGNIAWPLPMWTNPELYYELTAEELGYEYAKVLKTYMTWDTFSIVVILTIVSAVVSAQLAVHFVDSGLTRSK
jgi:hypothetical protein